MKKPELSIVSINHYIRLVYRSALFLWFLADYIVYCLFRNEDFAQRLEERPLVLGVIWIVFVVEMIRRFFPSGHESPGCQKQFARNYIKSGRTEIIIPDNNATVLVALIWIGFNGVIGAFHVLGILDDGIMILISGAYSVCDIICILFFCPFQTWFMKNKCCSACRIYNWDYAMMFTPRSLLPLRRRPRRSSKYRALPHSRPDPCRGSQKHKWAPHRGTRSWIRRGCSNWSRRRPVC